VPTCSDPWPVMVDERQIGRITSAAWSPRLKRNVGLSLIDKDYWEAGQMVSVLCQDGMTRTGEVSNLPMA